MKVFPPVVLFILAVLVPMMSVPSRGAAADLEAGEASYERTCKLCHGPNGKGVAAFFKPLKISPMPNITVMTDDRFKVAIRDGKGKMRPLPTNVLADDEIPDLIAFVHSLKK
jgi:cytochrome c oxidase cbb3-type subunit III